MTSSQQLLSALYRRPMRLGEIAWTFMLTTNKAVEIICQMHRCGNIEAFQGEDKFVYYRLNAKGKAVVEASKELLHSFDEQNTARSSDYASALRGAKGDGTGHSAAVPRFAGDADGDPAKPPVGQTPPAGNGASTLAGEAPQVSCGCENGRSVLGREASNRVDQAEETNHRRGELSTGQAPSAGKESGLSAAVVVGTQCETGAPDTARSPSGCGAAGFSGGSAFARSVVDYLTYRSYAHNRQISPDITPERWEKVFGPQAKQLEAKYQQEQNQPQCECCKEFVDKLFYHDASNSNLCGNCYDQAEEERCCGTDVTNERFRGFGVINGGKQ